MQNKNASHRLSLRWVRHAIFKHAYMNATIDTKCVIWVKSVLPVTLALQKGANARYATVTSF
jgi:hypothetical protein